MTDNEIIKALECCWKPMCGECPSPENMDVCRDELIKDALDLIKKQQEEIEMLEAEVDTYVTLAKDMHNKAITAFIRKLYSKAMRGIGTCDNGLTYKNQLIINKEDFNLIVKELVGDSNA